MRLALWSGLLSGFGESVVRTFRKTAYGVPLVLEGHIIWMPAAVNAVLFAALGVALLLLGRWLRFMRKTEVVVSLLAGLAVSDILWLFSPKFSAYAARLLGAGVGIQLGRLAGRRSGSLERLVARTVPVLTLLVPLSCLGVLGERA